MLTIVAGTRPECIKLAPLIQELRRRSFPLRVLHSNQHPPFNGFAFDDYWRCPELLAGTVLVQGDTQTAYDAAMVAERVIHLEAGVRSWQVEPYPEEHYRILIDERATHGFCATAENQGNLAGLPIETWVTGNTGVDACLSQQRPIPYHQRHGTVLVTLHRRESWGEPMAAMVEGLIRVARQHPDLSFHVSLHPNNALWTALAQREHLPPANVRTGPPMAYGTFLNKLAHAQAVLTDSGGVQEDACTLGIPCAVARDVTDRPESVASGHALVVGRTADSVEGGMLRVLSGLLRTDPAPVFGDGGAARRIADHLAIILGDRHENRSAALGRDSGPVFEPRDASL